MATDHIDVIIPVLNAEKTLKRTLFSLQQQTLKNIHVSVVDGGSTDLTEQIALEFSSKHLDLNFFSINGSTITEAVNFGIKHAKCGYIMPWMCADDFLDPDFLENSLEAMSNGSRMTLSPWKAVKNGRVLKTRFADHRWSEGIDYRMPKILSNTAVFKKDVFDQLGLLNEDYKYANDYEFLLRCKKNYIKSSICSENTFYNFETGGLSQTKLLECLKEVKDISILHGGWPSIANFQKLSSAVRVGSSYFLNRLRE